MKADSREALEVKDVVGLIGGFHPICHVAQFLRSDL